MVSLPLSLRDTPPHPEAVRVCGSRPDGLMDGVHTGGVWLWQDRAYKPLDGRAHPTASCLSPTLEAKMLKACDDLVLFPHNWWVEQHQGRRFLVRHRATILDQADQYQALSQDLVLQVEADIRAANRRGWQINDLPMLGYIRETTPFIVDLSACHYYVNPTHADDTTLVQKFFEICGQTSLIHLRDEAEDLLLDLHLFPEQFPLQGQDPSRFQHVYVSSVPSPSPDGTWPAETLVIPPIENLSRQFLVRAWVVTDVPLPSSFLSDHHLTWGWSDKKDEEGACPSWIQEKP